jgi:hypothetical protein
MTPKCSKPELISGFITVFNEHIYLRKVENKLHSDKDIRDTAYEQVFNFPNSMSVSTTMSSSGHLAHCPPHPQHRCHQGMARSQVADTGTASTCECVKKKVSDSRQRVVL